MFFILHMIPNFSLNQDRKLLHALRSSKFQKLQKNSEIWVFNCFFTCLLCQIFTLSAVPLKRMPTAIMECFSVLKPGGLLLFRDYGNGPATIKLLIEECKMLKSRIKIFASLVFALVIQLLHFLIFCIPPDKCSV